MKVTFVYPNSARYRVPDAYQPLVFAALAGLTPPDVELELHDDRLSPEIPYDAPTDLVAMSVETFAARRAYEIAANYRMRGVPVLLGGHHPTLLPDEAREYADAVAIGDGEGIWPEIIDDLRHKRLKRTYRREPPPCLDGLRFRRDIFRAQDYLPVVPVQFARGCRYSCDFCSVHAFYGSTVRTRPIAEVVREIEALEAKAIMFVDDNIFVDAPRTTELLQALVPLNIRWACQVDIHVSRDHRILELMRRSGCFVALVGLESLDPNNLKAMRKGWNAVHDYEEAVGAFHDHGIPLFGSFVLGYDADTPEVFARTLDFAMRMKLAAANFMPAYPMPGTRLYERLRAEGRLHAERWWLLPQYSAGIPAFTPKGMTSMALGDGCRWAKRAFYSHASILKRAMEPKASARTLGSLGLFLLFNYLTRRNVLKGRDF